MSVFLNRGLAPFFNSSINHSQGSALDQYLEDKIKKCRAVQHINDAHSGPVEIKKDKYTWLGKTQSQKENEETLTRCLDLAQANSVESATKIDFNSVFGAQFVKRVGLETLSKLPFIEAARLQLDKGSPTANLRCDWLGTDSAAWGIMKVDGHDCPFIVIKLQKTDDDGHSQTYLELIYRYYPPRTKINESNLKNFESFYTTPREHYGNNIMPMHSRNGCSGFYRNYFCYSALWMSKDDLTRISQLLQGKEIKNYRGFNFKKVESKSKSTGISSKDSK